jgi:SAM-dependent methyltransferase
MSYDKFSRFYDRVMGDRSDAAGYIASLIAHNKPDTTTMLEIACGTGTIMGLLSTSYAVTGLDRSRPMLAIARKKLPHVRFFRQDMTSFRIERRFDAIVCVFDSINHLLRFADWRKVFRRVALHLKDDGVFIFDINTLGKLQRLVKDPAWERWIGHDLAIIKVTGGRQGLFEWDVKIFEHQNRNSYRLFHEKISESAFPKQRVVSSLRSHFRQVKALDPFGAKASDRSERLYFVCGGRRA